MENKKLKNILEAALLAAGKVLSLDQMLALFLDEEQPSRADVRTALAVLGEELAERGIELIDVASGYRIQIRSEYAGWISRLWEERPTRYSRALLETLSIIAYRQPMTRGEIEEIRGVSVSTSIMRTLVEREWVRVVGHRDVPGRPAIYGTTKVFLEYFSLRGLNELPTLAEIRDIDSINAELDLDDEMDEPRDTQEQVDLMEMDMQAGEPGDVDSEDSASIEPIARPEDFDISDSSEIDSGPTIN